MLPKSKIPSKKEIKALRLEVLVKMSDLATAGFGLVAALAWNSAIQALFAKFMPETNGGLIAQIFYAIIVTVVVVLVTLKLSRMMGAAKNELDEVNKQDGK